jgi:outer membrane protein OmpA-like peptidoglycan-associated protein
MPVLKPVSAVRAPWAPQQEQLESEARRVAQRADEQDAHAVTAVTHAPTTGPLLQSPNDVPGVGQPLNPQERALFESRFGRDFSQVRVHADAPAAEMAEHTGARAFTAGDDIVFGRGEYQPGSPGGRSLLAHELTHTVQQEGHVGAPALQRDPQPDEKKGGIGLAPPAEAYTVAKGAGAEETHVLFAQDSADLSGAERKEVLAALEQYKSAVTVEVHGYASQEGSAQYNTNLSAHRAAAIKQFLQDHLPPGSTVVLYAHGETSDFGKLEQNRRAGLHIAPAGLADAIPVANAGTPAADAPRKVVDTSKIDWNMNPKIRFGPVNPNAAGPNLFPPITAGGGTTPAPSPWNFTVPPLRDPATIDWSAMRDPFTSRGLRLEERDAKQLELNWWTSYQFFRGLGLDPSQASWAANKGTAFAYDTQLAKDSPNVFDLNQRQWEQSLPPGSWKIGPVPLITPSTLGVIAEKIFKKKINFEF